MDELYPFTFSDWDLLNWELSVEQELELCHAA